MPSLSERVNLAECLAKGHPPDFVNASPIKKKVRGLAKSRWPVIIVILLIFAIAGVSWFVWAGFINPPTLS
jgi:hypothetical protein